MSEWHSATVSTVHEQESCPQRRESWVNQSFANDLVRMWITLTQRCHWISLNVIFRPAEDVNHVCAVTHVCKHDSHPQQVWESCSQTWVTIIFLLDRSLSHVEKPGSTVRIMFFDFSSAFNTIQPALLGDKLELAGVNQHLTSWILDYLTNRPQYVRTQDYVSDTLICSTGAPQGTVLAPFLFTLYTADFYH